MRPNLWDRVSGFLIFWFGFAFTVAVLYFAYVIGSFRLMSVAIVSIIVMIHGLYVMGGSKFSLSRKFWREKFGGTRPLWFGAVLDFYIFMAAFIALCAIFIIFLAPLLIQKLFALLLGNSLVCLLLYYKFKNKRSLDSYP